MSGVVRSTSPIQSHDYDYPQSSAAGYVPQSAGGTSRRRIPETGVVLQGLSAPTRPSLRKRLALGVGGVAAVPINAGLGAVVGVIEGGIHGSRIGHRTVPVLGAILGGAFGPVIGAIGRSVTSVKDGLVATRRGMEYAEVNKGLSLHCDSLPDIERLLSAIPADRISQDKNGHTLVKLNQGDLPTRNVGTTDRAMATLTAAIDHLKDLYDSHGNRYVDIDALVEKARNRTGAQIAIKAKDLRSSESPSSECSKPELCKVSREEQLYSNEPKRIKINIQAGADGKSAEIAGLQFIDLLDREVNGGN